MALYRLWYLVLAGPWLVGMGHLMRAACDWYYERQDRPLRRIYTARINHPSCRKELPQ